MAKKKLKKLKKPKKINRGLLVRKIDSQIFRLLIQDRGRKCQLCGKTDQIGVFHILPKSTHPKLRFYPANLLLTGWFCCHYPFHHDFYKARDVIVPALEHLIGRDLISYELYLKSIEPTMPKLTIGYLESLYEKLRLRVGG